MRRLSFSTRLSRPTERAWGEATNFEDLNYEFWPVLRMTLPKGYGPGTRLDDLPVGSLAGRSRILLFGFIPADYDDLTLVEVEPPRRFLERSRTLSFSTWEHERIIDPDGEGSIVTDRLGLELRPALRRVPGFEAIAVRVVSFLFSHRHRRLRRRDTACDD